MLNNFMDKIFPCSKVINAALDSNKASCDYLRKVCSVDPKADELKKLHDRATLNNEVLKNVRNPR